MNTQSMNESEGQNLMPSGPTSSGSKEYEQAQKIQLEHFRTLFRCEPDRITNTIIQFVAEDITRLQRTIVAALDRIDRLERHQHQDGRILIPLEDLRRELGKISPLMSQNLGGRWASWQNVLDATLNQGNPTHRNPTG